MLMGQIRASVAMKVTILCGERGHNDLLHRVHFSILTVRALHEV
jgi:hypothetical protein